MTSEAQTSTQVHHGELTTLTRFSGLHLLIICVVVLISRLPYLEHSPLSWDASSFYLAATDFNIAADRPHLPGYFLHVLFIRAFRLIFSPFTANVAPSLFWSLLGACLFYLLSIRWLARLKALLLSLFLSFNPMLWFYGCSSEIYAFDFCASLAVVYCGLTPRALMFLPSILALIAGVRQSTAVLLLPLYLWFYYLALRERQMSWRTILIAHVVGLLVLTSWVIPFLSACGGIDAYFKLYATHPPGAFADKLSNVVSIMQYGIYAFSGTVMLWLVARFARRGDVTNNGFEDQNPSLVLLALWVAPSLMMFLLTTYTKGYMLIFLAATVLLLVRKLRATPPWVIALGCLVNIVIFTCVPYHLPAPSIWMAPRVGASRWSKAVERVTTVFSMTGSQLRSLNQYHDAVDRFLVDSVQHQPIFVDPSFPLTARVLQTRHPDTQFGMIYTLDTNTILVHQDIRQWAQHNTREFLGSACILTTVAVVRENHALTVLEQDGELALCRVRAEEVDNATFWYSSHFVRQ